MKIDREKVKGSVSIFLVIILVPMLAISALFVDAGKMRLSEGLVSSAADLALNSAMANYDSKLKDFYGLFATAQNTDELLDSLEDFYVQSISSSGITESDSKTIIGGYFDGLRQTALSGNIDNILQIESDSFNISAAKDGTLANSSVLKKQIVEFMKFRGPINTGLSFLESLKSFATISKQQELIDKKQEYYEAQNDVMEKAYEAWSKLNDYNKTSIVAEPEFLSNVQFAIKTMQDNLPEYAKKTSKNFYKGYRLDQTKYLDEYPVLQISTDVNEDGEIVEYYLTISNQKKSTSDYKEFNDSNRPDAKEITQQLYKVVGYADKMNKNYDSVANIIDTYEIYHPQAAIQLERLDENGDGFRQAYLNLKNYTEGIFRLIHVWKYFPDDGKQETTNLNASRAENTLENLYRNEINAFNTFITGTEVSSGYSRFNYMQDRVDNIYAQTEQQLLSSGEFNDTDTFLKNNSQTIINSKDQLSKGRDALVGCDNALNELKALINGELETAKNNWKTAAEDPAVKSTTLAKQDKAELESLTKYLNDGDIEKLQMRINGIKDKIDGLINAIDSNKFLGVPISSYTDMASLQENLSQRVGDTVLKSLSVNRTQLDIKLNELFDNKYEGDDLDVSWLNDSNTNPILSSNTPNFYSYLYTHFNKGEVSVRTDQGRMSEDTKNSNKASFSDLKDEMKKKADESTSTASQGINTTYEIVSNPNRPSAKRDVKGKIPGDNETATDSKAPKKNAEKTNGLFKSLTESLGKMAESLRDNLYVSDYIVSMFSYDTIEKEIAKSNKGDSPIETKTLTKELINSRNNHAMGAEVEYILYGGTNSANKSKVAATIYGIRLAMNLIYAFTDSEIRSMAFAIATPISAATMGIIPVPLIQGAVIIGLSCVESGLDLQALKDGESVRLFKSKDSWVTSPSGFVSLVKYQTAEAIKTTANAAISTGSEFVQDALNMTSEELKEFVNDKSGEFDAFVSNYADELTASATNQISLITDKLSTLANQVVEMGITNSGMTKSEKVQYIKDELKKSIDLYQEGPIKESMYVVYEKIISNNIVDELIDGIDETINNYGAGVNEKLRLH